MLTDIDKKRNEINQQYQQIIAQKDKCLEDQVCRYQNKHNQNHYIPNNDFHNQNHHYNYYTSKYIRLINYHNWDTNTEYN